MAVDAERLFRGREDRIAAFGCSGPGRPRVRQIREVIEERLVVLERIGRRLRLDRRVIPQRLVTQGFEIARLAAATGLHVEESGEKAGRYLILRPPAV